LEGRGAPVDARVWAAARGIPFGSVASYGEVAARLDLPRAARAVGRALSRNPLAIFIPCHRVVGADGSLVGFSSGLSQKAALLWHEGVRLEGGPGRWRVARAGLARASRPRRAPESAARGGGGRPPDFEDRHP
ncbi:MAG: methylated-DNA--[protein]-cysteine S-methyltransferase, partial [Planctomycetota bacterium]